MAAEDDTTRRKTKTRYRCYPNLCIRLIGIVQIVVLYVLLVGHASAEDWHDTYGGMGTTHEQLGQVHYPDPELTPYTSKVEYTKEKKPHTWSATPAYNISQFLFDSTINDKPPLPDGYLTVKNGDTLAMGSKVDTNDWSDLLAQYALVILWVIFLLIVIIVLPFLAVCYCCFCCCRRCKRGCGPCDGPRDKRMSMICAGILLLLVILILLGAIVAFASNRVLDRGLDETSEEVKRGSQDTCLFLEDINAHLNHIFVYNYLELENHLHELMTNAHSHIFLDLADTSESNAIEQLERIMDNMEEARTLMRQVDSLEKELRFYTSQLRDGVRGAKRDVNYACGSLVNGRKCKDFLRNSEMESVDMSPCLHMDFLPNTTVFVHGVEQIADSDVRAIPQTALLRFQEIGVKIEHAMGTILIPMLLQVRAARDQFRMHANRLTNLTEALISNIQLKTIRSTRSFEDVYDRFGYDRSAINSLVCGLLFIIVFLMLVSLMCGCCGRRGSGATCLLIAIMFIFIVFSLITLVGLFYFIMGLIAYQGACAPVRDLDKTAVFKHLDASLDVFELMEEEEPMLHELAELKMSTTINACMANESIFDLLVKYKLYNLNHLRDIEVIKEKPEDEKREVIFDEDLSSVFLLTKEEREKFETIRNGDLSEYNSVLYLSNMCRTLTPNLANLATGLRQIRDSIAYNEKWEEYNKYARASLSNEAYHLDTYNMEWTDKILGIMSNMKNKLSRIDDLILYEKRNFSNSIKVLVDAVVRSETFIQKRGTKFIDTLAKNLTDVVSDQIDQFKEGLINECTKNVGRCAPLAYVYYRGVDQICYRLVDPMNGFWVGLLPAALLLLPLLIVAHKLMCLWRRLHSYAVPIVIVPETGPTCPTCSGQPYTPPPIFTCSGGQQASCVCREMETKRTDGGATYNDSSSIATSEQNVIVEPAGNPVAEPQNQIQSQLQTPAQAQAPPQESAAIKPKND
ncbi:PREDICTED: prominin-like protein [Drosophila arizonae]|uniref:Prominin-like protein n=1 Tax=Drosophila arizonae TaxID=7263 RepID=A0ABM1P4Z6_DROAR|nr:PREDICTED: prominin-like protein [Drosophila arizonae]